MFVQDKIADMLTRIRNANQMRYQTVVVEGTKMTLGIAEILKNEGYIDMAENGPIVLTEKGLEKAQKIYNRHRILTEFLEVITKVPKVQAEENACRIEHVLDEDVFQGIQQYLENQKQGGTK